MGCRRTKKNGPRTGGGFVARTGVPRGAGDIGDRAGCDGGSRGGIRHLQSPPGGTCAIARDMNAAAVPIDQNLSGLSRKSLEITHFRGINRFSAKAWNRRVVKLFASFASFTIFFAIVDDDSQPQWFVTPNQRIPGHGTIDRPSMLVRFESNSARTCINGEAHATNMLRMVRQVEEFDCPRFHVVKAIN